MKTLKLNQQYLNFENPGTRVLAVESGKGTGKTRWLQTNVAEEPTLFITHRVALAKDVANRNKAAYYKDGSSIYTSPRLVICINSLMALLGSEVHTGATIVIDEATQLLRHLIGETCRNFRREIYWALANKLYYCKQLILLDADMNEETLNFFVNLMNWKEEKVKEEDITWVKNNWNPKDKLFREFPSNESLQLDLINSVKQGLNCFIACDTKSQVDTVGALLRRAAPEVKGLLTVNGDNSGDEEQSKFIANVNELQKNYQVIAASPSLSTGVDISEPHFDKVYLFANGYASTAGDLLQATSRVRTVKEVNFWVAPTVNHEEDNWKEILKSLIKINFNFPGGRIPKSLSSKDVWALDYDPTTNQVSVSDKIYIDMQCQIKALENQSLNELHNTFTEKASSEGRVEKVYLSKGQEKAADQAKELTKELKKELKDQKHLAILNAEPISELEFFVLESSQDVISEEERLKLKRCKLLDLIGGVEDYLPLAVQQESKMFKAVYYQGLLRRDIMELREQDQKDKSNKIATDRKHRVETRELLESFLDVINYKNSLENGETINCNHKPSMFGDFGTWFINRRVEFKELLGLNVPGNVREKPMQFIQTVLGLLGIKTEARQRRVNGERIREYFIDRASVEIMNRIMEAREAAQQKKVEEQQKELAGGMF